KASTPTPRCALTRCWVTPRCSTRWAAARCSTIAKSRSSERKAGPADRQARAGRVARPALSKAHHRGYPMPSLAELLDQSAALHRHLCPRQVLGVRMGLLAAEVLGLDLPQTDK